MSIKRRVYKTIQPHKTDDIPSIIFDWFIAFVIAVNICILVFGTLNLPQRILFVFYIIEVSTAIIFTVEYLLRLWTADIIYRNKNPFRARLRYIFTFVMIMDLIAIIALYLHLAFSVDTYILSIFRLFRLIWFFKIKRQYIKVFSSIIDVFKKKALLLLFSLTSIFTIMVIASVLMYHAEKQAQPEIFGNAVSGLWWAVITISTVGYGEIYPVTVLGKVLGAFFSIMSMGLIAVPTGIMSSGFVEKAREERIQAKGNKSFCPYCGKNIEE
ncbi:MAG: ion transporter [Oscillospiraceae bacterium]|nr:ion transporter [Oscillospiraceae bacterium]